MDFYINPIPLFMGISGQLIKLEGKLCDNYEN